MAYANEQSVEATHPLNDEALDQYDSQRGAAQIEGYMKYILLETSPKYQ